MASENDTSSAAKSSNLKDFKVLVSKCRIKTELDADTAIEISRALTEAYVQYKLANFSDKDDQGIKDSYSHALTSLKSLKPTLLKTQIPTPPPPVVHKSSSKSSKRKATSKSDAGPHSKKSTSKEAHGKNVESAHQVTSQSSNSTPIPFTTVALAPQPTQNQSMPNTPGVPIMPTAPGMPLPNMAMPPPGMFMPPPGMPLPPQLPMPPQFPGVPPAFMPGMPVTSGYNSAMQMNQTSQ